jgi:hypothetical protein
MLLMKIDWSAPLSFQIPAGTKYSQNGWVLIDLPFSNFTPAQVTQYRIQEITDSNLILDLSFLNYTVLGNGNVAYITTVVDPNPEQLADDHLTHFVTLDPSNIPTFLAGYKYISKLEIINHYDELFENNTPHTSNLEASTFPQQLAEAQALQANPSYPTPLLLQISQASGISVSDLAQRVLAKQSTYQGAQAQLLGQMIADEAAVDACTTPLEVKNLGWC